MSAESRAPMNMWIALVAGIVACLAAALGAYLLASYSWSQLVDYRSPFVASPAPASLVSVEPTPSPALVQRVVLVIVDGLREDVSRSSMPTLNTLRGYGSDVSITVPQPSLSYPNWTTILAGASPVISGVTTNGRRSREPAPTLVDIARAAGQKVVVVGPTDFETLFGITPGPDVSLRLWPKTGYLTSQLVDDALRLSKESSSGLVVVHLPDLDEAGHRFGGGSAVYRDLASRIDVDVARLVAGLQGDGTAFVITADHGQTDSGGHGGWEPQALNVPAVFAGSGIGLSKGTGDLQQIAPTVSVLLGLNDPPYAEGQALRSVIATDDGAVFGADAAHHIAFDAHYIGVVTGVQPSAQELVGDGGPDAAVALAIDQRLETERNNRAATSLAICLVVLIVAAVVVATSWRAFVSALVGCAAYYAVYETLFFVVHGYGWSMSVMNTEALVKTFMAWRMGEAAAAALLGVAVATAVYPLLRREPKGPQVGRFLPGYLALAPATLLAVLSTLALQVAWYLWRWGAAVVWTLPDLRAGFKYDLDLVQMTAVGAAVVLAPLVAYLIGRYHPKVRAGGG